MKLKWFPTFPFTLLLVSKTKQIKFTLRLTGWQWYKDRPAGDVYFRLCIFRQIKHLSAPDLLKEVAIKDNSTPRFCLLFCVFWALGVEPGAFLHPELYSHFYFCFLTFYFAIGSHQVPKLPRLGTCLQPPCLRLSRCWDYTPLTWGILFKRSRFKRNQFASVLCMIYP